MSFALIKTPVKQALRSATTAVLAAGLLFSPPESAQSLTGGKYVGPDDIGAKASVALYYHGKPFCGGVVFQDRYILSAAHCFTDGRGNIVKSAKGIEVRYWSSAKPKRNARKVEKLTIHENLLHQERAAYPSAQPGDFINFPVNHEDIAVLKLKSTHPAGSMSAFVPAIDNEYAATGGRGNSTWFYVY